MQEDLLTQSPSLSQLQLEAVLFDREDSPTTAKRNNMEEQMIENAIEESRKIKQPVLVKTDSNKVVKDGKRYIIDKQGGIVSLND